MSTFSRIVAVGNIVSTPELRTTTSGVKVSDMRIAISEKNQETVFIDVVVWDKLAETVCQWKKKGDLVMVVGKLQDNSWTDEASGKKINRLRIVATEVTFL